MTIPSPQKTMKDYQQGLERAINGQTMTKPQVRAHDRIMACLVAFEGVRLQDIKKGGFKK